MAIWHTRIEVGSDKIYVKSGDRSASYYGKFWVARIVGLDPKFGLNRVFVNNKELAVIAEDGIYEVFRTCQWAKRPENYFIEIKGSQYELLSKEEVTAKFKQL